MDSKKRITALTERTKLVDGDFVMLDNAETGTAKFNLKTLNDTSAPAIGSTASGTIANFPDGADGLPVKSLIAHIEPVQDLNGYDHPWVGGSGRNKLENKCADATFTAAGGTVTTTVNPDGSITINSDVTSTVVIYGNIQTGFVGSSAGQNDGKKHLANGTYIPTPLPSGIKFQVYGTNAESGTGDLHAIATSNYGEFTIDDTYMYNYCRLAVNGTFANQVIYPMIRLASDTDDTYEPYENICPITGHTEANVMRTRKNLLNDTIRYQSTNKQTVVFGQTNAYSAEQKTFLKAGTYTFSVKLDSTQRTSGYYKKTGDTETTRLWLSISGDASGVFTLDEDSWCAFWIYSVNALDSENIFAQVEPGSTATEYEPYEGETYPITFPSEAGTVYGGYVDAVNGELVVDMARVDVGTLDFFAVSPVLTTGFAGRTQPNNRLFGTDITEAYCDSYAFWGNGSTSQISSGIQNGQFAYQTTNRNVWFRNDSCNTLEELKTALSGVYLVYKLSEPIHYQLTPQQITTLLGTNNIWNDANGETDVEYRADTKLYIEQLTKPTENDMTADHAISSGTFFMLGNTLYLATAAIAAGATIIEGTNATRLSLADALNTLNA